MSYIGEMRNLTIGDKTYSFPSNISTFTNDSGYITGMTILSYGGSTWADFLSAYTAKKVVYCRASSNANPATGSQTRLAFMAYVNNADSPTNVEFQYYRSVSSHSASQQGDQVYVYKLDKTAGWTVTTREASVKININNNNEGIKTTYSSGVVTIGHANAVTAQTTSGIYPIKIDAQGHISEYGSAVTIPSQASDIGAQPTLISGTNIKTINNGSILGSGNLTIKDAFVATYNVTSFADVLAAYNAGKTILATKTETDSYSEYTWTRLGTLMGYDVYDYEEEGVSHNISYFRFSVPSGYGTEQFVLVLVDDVDEGWTFSENYFVTGLNINNNSYTYASFYAPMTSGTSGQLLTSNGSGNAPTWTTVSIPTNLVNGSATGSLRTIYSAVEGSNYTIGSYAMAEGATTKASGITSHAEGNSTEASGNSSHAEGVCTIASGLYSHAGGYFTTAQRRSQTTIGEYNTLDSTGSTVNDKGDYIFIIGNGTGTSARSNALTVDWSGNTIIQTGLEVGGVDHTITTSEYNTLITNLNAI